MPHLIVKMNNVGKCDYYPNRDRVKCGKKATHRAIDGLVAGNEYCTEHIKVVEKRLPGIKVRVL